MSNTTSIKVKMAGNIAIDPSLVCLPCTFFFLHPMQKWHGEYLGTEDRWSWRRIGCGILRRCPYGRAGIENDWSLLIEVDQAIRNNEKGRSTCRCRLFCHSASMLDGRKHNSSCSKLSGNWIAAEISLWYKILVGSFSGAWSSILRLRCEIGHLAPWHMGISNGPARCSAW